MKPSILFIVPAEYEALRKKGVENMIFERDEGGFFGKVITVHPFASRTQKIVLNDCHEIYEIGFDLIPGSERFDFLRYVQYPVHFFRIIWTVIRLVKKFRIDIIRAMDPYWIGLIGSIGSRVCKVPFCVSIHADYDHMKELGKNVTIAHVFGSYKLAKLLEKYILSQAFRVMPIRKTLGERAVVCGAAPEKIRVIPHGIDLSPFNLPPAHDVCQHFKIDSSIKIISYAGRLAKENYVDDILLIVRKLYRKRKDFMLVIAGGGEEENRIKSEVVSDVILKEHILLAGFQSREICFDLRRASDVSLCLMGGFSLIEACAAASPVVSYDVVWHSELVKDKETGFLIKEHDIDGAVDALDWILENPKESDAMGQRAKALAFERHDLKNTSDVKIKCYLEMLSQGTDS